MHLRRKCTSGEITSAIICCDCGEEAIPLKALIFTKVFLGPKNRTQEVFYILDTLHCRSKRVKSKDYLLHYFVKTIKSEGKE